MKRFMALILFVVMVTGSIVCSASGEKAIRTDITAEIDYTPIETYNVKGFTYIPVDILHNYGFEVTYNGDTINVDRIRYATPMMTREMWEDSIREKNYADIITDNKKVYLDGVLANSVSTSDGVLMMVDELQKYGGFNWNEQEKKVEIKIFENELAEDYDNATDKVELTVDASEIYHWAWKDTKANYVGQVDEKSIPNGIGRYLFGMRGTTRIHVIGYFKNGKPDGYICRNMFRTVTKTYKNRWSHFIGCVDADEEIPIAGDDVGNLFNNGNNFGATSIPFRMIDEWTGPEMLAPNPYQNGVYYENLIDIQHDRMYTFVSWKYYEDQTCVEKQYSTYGEENKPLKTRVGMKVETLEDITDFTQYQNNQEVYYNGGIQTVSEIMDEYGSYILNSPSDGAGFYPSKFDIIFNGKKMKRYEMFMLNDRILLPCRAFFEDIGATVEWRDTHEKWGSSGEVTIKKDGRVVVLNTKNNIMTVNGEEREIDTTPLIIESRTYIPLRAVAEALDAKVEWDEDLKDVIITL